MSHDVAIDLRFHSRFAVVDREAWIEWNDGGGGGGACVELVNISLGGAMVLAPVALHVGQVVWFNVQGLPPWRRVAAAVVRAQPGRRVHPTHLEFRPACSSILLAAAVGDAAMIEAVLDEAD